MPPDVPETFFRGFPVSCPPKRYICDNDILGPKGSQFYPEIEARRCFHTIPFRVMEDGKPPNIVSGGSGGNEVVHVKVISHYFTSGKALTILELNLIFMFNLIFQDKSLVPRRYPGRQSTTVYSATSANIHQHICISVIPTTPKWITGYVCVGNSGCIPVALLLVAPH